MNTQQRPYAWSFHSSGTTVTSVCVYEPLLVYEYPIQCLDIARNLVCIVQFVKECMIFDVEKETYLIIVDDS